MTACLRLLALFLVALALPARAQDPDTEAPLSDEPVEVVPGEIRMDLHPIADGILREGQWSTVRVTLANGAASTVASVEMEERQSLSDGNQRFRRAVELPRGSKKDIQLLWRAGSATREREIRVQVGDEAVRRSFPVRMLTQDDVGIGVIGLDSLGTVAVREAWEGPVPGQSARINASDPRQVRSGLIPVADLPDKALGLSALDWIVWPQADPTDLSPEQLDALLTWVATGGNLLVSATDSWSVVADSELNRALPVDLIGESDGSADGWLAELGADGGGVRVPIATALPRTGPVHSASVLALADDGRPLWVAGAWGLGSVHALLLDPAVGPIARDVSREELWRTLLWIPSPDEGLKRYLNGPPGMAEWVDYGAGAFFPDELGASDATRGGPRLAVQLGLATPSRHGLLTSGLSSDQLGDGWYEGDEHAQFDARMRDLLSDIPGVAPLPLPWLAGFAIVYLLLIGPVDYAVLRLLKRQPLTWITFPILVAIFSAVALIGTSIIKGSQAIVTRYEVVDVLPGTGVWRGHTWLGIFSTAKNDLSLIAGYDDSIVRTVGDGGFVQESASTSSEGAGRFEWRAQTWSLAYLQSEWADAVPGGIELSAAPDGALVLTNHLGVDLSRAELHTRGHYLDLGPLRDGGTARIEPSEPTLTALAELVWSTGRRTGEGQEPSARRPIITFTNTPDTYGGQLNVQSPVGLVGVHEGAFEPLTLTGLSPVSEPVTVFRAPLYLTPLPAEAP